MLENFRANVPNKQIKLLHPVLCTVHYCKEVIVLLLKITECIERLLKIDLCLDWSII